MKRDKMRGERGQVLPMMILAAATLIAIAGIAIDFGRIMVAKAELTRAVDGAALAGTLELPDIDAAEDTVALYMTENDPTAVVEVTNSPAERQVEVRARKTVDVWFLDVLNVVPGFDVLPDATVRSRAVAGFGLQPVDVHLAIDGTGSMGQGCNGSQTNSGCPIKEAKDAAAAFVNTLMEDNPAASVTQVAVALYRGCYNPPRTNSNCVSVSNMTLDLTTNKTALLNKIGQMSSQGGSGTNNCWAMLKGQQHLFGPNGQTSSNVLKIMVILTDGDNTYNDVVYSTSQGSPPNDCRPWIDPDESDNYVGSNCHDVNGSFSSSSGQGRERQLDILTYDMAQDLKSQGVEIYVVSLGACGSSNNNLCSTGIIGTTTHDNTADRNLGKCIASSTGGTNDHFFDVEDADDLPEVFENIAQQIGFRLIE